MKKINKFSLFCVSVAVALSLAGCAKQGATPQNSGLKFENSAKQEYMAAQMDKFFNPDKNAPKPAPFSAPSGWEHSEIMSGELKIEKLANLKSNSNLTILQLHGGGYVGGLNDRYRNFALKHASVTGAKEIYMLNYRLAPKFTYPAALDDAFSAYEYLLANGVKPENIAIIGDSAGGNLALALSLYLKEKNVAQPRLMVLISPWTDMSMALASKKDNAKKDAVLGEKNKFLYKEIITPPSYAKNFDLKDPRLSPLYADLSDLPPMLIQVGAYELLADDGVELARRLAKANGEFSLSVYSGMPHDFALVMPELWESESSFIEIKDFINRY
ncbi:alpha/beta hydrolase [Campylobacter sp. JMF_08 NE1]|uniref:alpha/beta hydrolase n=1 Tax=Campylobacter sp. JMF_08 NE1 TaxID=2983821 RepID=UPI0022E9E3F2|nr:alpha/beta hydrolase [Campylobacter sp. JMF_08 NE1]MDA3047889.1 alpha/beta hydrolase [Campylobacter sp. JMF_08 NE1]